MNGDDDVDDVTVNCSSCSGSGLVKRWSVEFACPLCGGRGYIVTSAKNAEQTGESLFEEPES